MLQPYVVDACALSYVFTFVLWIQKQLQYRCVLEHVQCSFFIFCLVDQNPKDWFFLSCMFGVATILANSGTICQFRSLLIPKRWSRFRLVTVSRVLLCCVLFVARFSRTVRRYAGKIVEGACEEVIFLLWSLVKFATLRSVSSWRACPMSPFESAQKSTLPLRYSNAKLSLYFVEAYVQSALKPDWGIT